MTNRILQKLFLFIFILFFTHIITYADSGGPLSPNQAAYDVNYYDLDLEINPSARTIGGSLLCRIEIMNPIDTLEMDLDNPFTVDSILFKLNDGTFSTVTFKGREYKAPKDIERYLAVRYGPQWRKPQRGAHAQR